MVVESMNVGPSAIEPEDTEGQLYKKFTNLVFRIYINFRAILCVYVSRGRTQGLLHAR